MNVFLVAFLKKLVMTIKTLSDRLIVKKLLSNNAELPITKWFSIQFLKSLTISQFLGLGIIASFTLVTFPLGIWLSSFQLGLGYPTISMMVYGFEMVMLPINIFLFNATLNEFKINTTTITGLIIVEIGLLLGVAGWYLMLKGNQ